MATDLTLYLNDQPGELARVGDVLGKAGANIARPVRAAERRRTSRGSHTRERRDGGVRSAAGARESRSLQSRRSWCWKSRTGPARSVR